MYQLKHLFLMKKIYLFSAFCISFLVHSQVGIGKASVDGDGTVVIIDTTGILVLDNYKKTQTFAQELRLVAGGGKKYLYP